MYSIAAVLCLLLVLLVVIPCPCDGWTFGRTALLSFALQSTHNPQLLPRVPPVPTAAAAASATTTTDSSHFYSKKTFSELGVHPKLQRILESTEIVTPSKVQALSFQRVLSGRPVIIGDQTGSGKTLAYLLPILQRCLMAQRTDATDGDSDASSAAVACSRAPLVVIMTPTTELAQYVVVVYHRFSPYWLTD
jgi:superfamily II DNA/RNA helicase